MTQARFIAGIAVLVHDPKTDRYLLLRRAGSKDFGAGTWECVTGRVEHGESFVDAARRELSEEIGVAVDLDFLLGTSHFYRGAAEAENELLGVYFHGTLRQPAEGVRLSHEHDAHVWLPAAAASGRLGPSHWLTPVVERAARLRPLLLDQRHALTPLL